MRPINVLINAIPLSDDITSHSFDVLIALVYSSRGTTSFVVSTSCSEIITIPSPQKFVK